MRRPLSHTKCCLCSIQCIYLGLASQSLTAATGKLEHERDFPLQIPAAAAASSQTMSSFSLILFIFLGLGTYRENPMTKCDYVLALLCQNPLGIH